MSLSSISGAVAQEAEKKLGPKSQIDVEKFQQFAIKILNLKDVE